MRKLIGLAADGAGIDQSQLSLAERIVERAAFYEARILRGSFPAGEQSATISQLSHEYGILRIALVSSISKDDVGNTFLNLAVGMAPRSSRYRRSDVHQVER